MDGSPAQSFRLWFPEIIWHRLNRQYSFGDKRTFNKAFNSYGLYSKKDNSWHNTVWEAVDGQGLQRTLDFSDGSVYAKATPFAGGVLLELSLCNKSDDVWKDCYAEICLQLANAPDFADIRRDRTYGRISGDWGVLASTPTACPNPQNNTYNATPPKPFLWETLRGWWTNDIHVTLDHPVIFVRSFSGDAIIGIGFTPCIGYCNNLSPTMACIHSDPYIGNIPPGHKRQVTGRVFYSHESIEAFVGQLDSENLLVKCST